MKRIIYFFRWLFCPKELRPYLAPDGTRPIFVCDYENDFFYNVDCVNTHQSVTFAVGYDKRLDDEQLKEMSK